LNFTINVMLRIKSNDIILKSSDIML